MAYVHKASQGATRSDSIFVCSTVFCATFEVLVVEDQDPDKPVWSVSELRRLSGGWGNMGDWCGG